MMQNFPLRVGGILDHAARYHPNRPVIGRSVEGPIVKSTWAAVHREAKQVAAALKGLGIEKGDVIGVMAWNTVRHLSVWYGIPGAGAVNHTLNPRLFADQLVYIINHAEDRFIMVDLDLLPIFEAIIDKLPKIEKIIVLTDRAHMPETTLDVICYGDMIEGQPDNEPWDSKATKTSRAAFATPPAPPETRRAWAIPTAPMCCTRWPLRRPI